MGGASLALIGWLGIQGGAPAAVCEAPAAVQLTGELFCTGALVRPDVVVFAAHCGIPEEVVVGERTDTGMRIATEHCQINPLVDGEPGGADFAYCRLAEPAPVALPPPPIRGCELEQLSVGMPVMMVGFGHTPDAGPGTKHVAMATITELALPTFIFAGDAEAGTCGGDSGGPLYGQLADGSWRLLGILTGSGGVDAGANCGGMSAYNSMDRLTPLVEGLSNLDLSPCHDLAGQWAPAPVCVAPGEMTGDAWETACAGPTMSPATCGPAAVPPDATEPWVEILEPADGAVLAAGADVTFVADAGDSYPGGIQHVTLLADGVPLLDPNGLEPDAVPPYGRYGVALEPGEHVLTARVRAWGGAEVEGSVVVTVEGGAGSGTGTGTGMGTAGAGGARCSYTQSAGGSAWLWVPVAGLWFRRRWMTRA